MEKDIYNQRMDQFKKECFIMEYFKKNNKKKNKKRKKKKKKLQIRY